MGSTFWIAIAVIAVVSIIGNTIVKIIHGAKSSGGKARFKNVEADLAALEADLADARDRIAVLEKIVTDEKYNLSREIDDLAQSNS